MVIFTRYSLHLLFSIKHLNKSSAPIQARNSPISDDLRHSFQNIHVSIDFSPKRVLAVFGREALEGLFFVWTELCVDFTLPIDIRSFVEFPLQRQYAIARVSILEEFERSRVILREGHRAEKFYLIVDGISKHESVALFSANFIHLADVYKLRQNPFNKTFSSRLVAVLKKGSSFGVRVFFFC